jgi:hypothetical protein
MRMPHGAPCGSGRGGGQAAAPSPAGRRRRLGRRRAGAGRPCRGHHRAKQPGEALAKRLRGYTGFPATKRGLAPGLHSGDPAPYPTTSRSASDPPSGRCSKPQQRLARSAPTSARRTSPTPSPTCVCPRPTSESLTASAWSRTSSTDYATAPIRASLAPEIVPGSVYPSRDFAGAPR